MIRNRFNLFDISLMKRPDLELANYYYFSTYWYTLKGEGDTAIQGIQIGWGVKDYGSSYLFSNQFAQF